jgi:MGT family glycosyltransferase
MGIVGEVLDADLPAMRAEPADYTSPTRSPVGGQWIAQLLGVPVVTSVTTFAINRHVVAFAASHGVCAKSVRLMASKLEQVAKALILRRRLSRFHQVRGLGVFRTVFGRSDLNIVYTSRAFQPRSETFDQSFHFVGPPVGSRTEPAAEFSWPSAMRPIVYVSLGTLFNVDVGFYRHCLEAFCDESVQVIMSVGSRVFPGDLGPAPANVTVASSVPQLEVLQRASAFVTHGGMNSVSESLRMGVPMVTVPQMVEQEIVSRRVEQLSAGLYLDKAEVSPDRLRLSVRRLLAEERFRRAVAGVGETLLAAGGTAEPATLVKTVAALAPTRGS